MDAGKLDRLITFQTRSLVTDPDLGTVTSGGWTNLATVYAEMRDILPSRGESMNETLNTGRQPVRVRIRYRSDITSDMRFLYNGRTYHVVAGPAEMGRRYMLEMMAEEYTSADETA